MTGGHVASQTSQAVVSTVTYLKQRAGFPMRASLRVLGLPRATYFAWQRTAGKMPRASGVTPKGHHLTPAERAAIVAYKRQHPGIGYRRLAYRMLDAGVVAVPASSVYRVISEAGLATCWTQTPGQAHKQGFDQPQRIHEQWHTDIAYLNILGTNYFFIGVLDGYSRAIMHHEVRLDMTTTDVEIVVERALAHLPHGTPTPRLISDNGAQYVSRQFKSYLRERDVSHSRARPYHPQSNGKMERFHKSLKVECVRITAMSDLEEARRLIGRYVQDYNAQRLHSALHYLTPADYLRGPEHVQHRLMVRRTALAEAARHRRDYWKAVEEEGGASVTPIGSQQITPAYHVA
jgi:transposase InsO family protein